VESRRPVEETTVSTQLGVTVEDVQNVLIAVAPIVGAARVVSATGKVADALGVAIAIAEASE
jgi:hypothetical protein